MTATAVQEKNIDTLKGRITDFDERIGRARTDIQAKQKAAGRAILEGCDATPIEEDIARISNHIDSLVSAKEEGERQLSEATAELNAASLAESQERIKCIRSEIEQVVADMETHLARAKATAQAVDELLKEARHIHVKTNLPLSPVGSWINILPAFHGRSLIGEGIESLQEKIKQIRPKG